MPGGRPVAWYVGSVPPNIGLRAEHHDKDGLFLAERKLREEWDDYLKTHTPGTTERKFDNGMRKKVTEVMTTFIKKIRLRTDAATKVYEMDEATRLGKRMIISNNEAIAHYNSKNEEDAQGDRRLPEQPTVREIGHYLASVVDLEATDDLCNVLKNYVRVNLLVDSEAERAVARNPLVQEFKNLNHEVIILKDDIIYLINKMRETASEYERAVDDEDYELPAVDLILKSLPSTNKTSRRDEMAQIAALASPSAAALAAAGDDLEAQMAAAEDESAGLASSSDDDEEEEQPAKKRAKVVLPAALPDDASSIASSPVSDPSLE